MSDIDGGEAYDRIKKIDANLNVLLSSEYTVDGQAEEILGHDCDGFIHV